MKGKREKRPISTGLETVFRQSLSSARAIYSYSAHCTYLVFVTLEDDYMEFVPFLRNVKGIVSRD